MTIKKTTLFFGFIFFIGLALTSFAADNEHKMNQMDHMNDGRISLGLPAKMKMHQLANMRSHVDAIRTIVGLMGDGDFDSASKIAHLKLGLTPEMKKMCSMFNNDDFKKLGFAFHNSGDALAKVLKTKDMTKSLHALHTTMNYCVQCHATFRQ